MACPRSFAGRCGYGFNDAWMQDLTLFFVMMRECKT